MRLIDADFEEAHYTSMTTNPTPDVTEQDKRNSHIIVRALQMAKTVDAVRVGENLSAEEYDIVVHVNPHGEYDWYRIERKEMPEYSEWKEPFEKMTDYPWK